MKAKKINEETSIRITPGKEKCLINVSEEVETENGHIMKLGNDSEKKIRKIAS